VYYRLYYRGKSTYRAQDRRTRVRIKTRPPKEGINRIDNKELIS
jgi:hypothetical protein